MRASFDRNRDRPLQTGASAKTQPASAEPAPPRRIQGPSSEPAAQQELSEPRSEAGKRVSEETYWTLPVSPETLAELAEVLVRHPEHGPVEQEVAQRAAPCSGGRRPCS